MTKIFAIAAASLPAECLIIFVITENDYSQVNIDGAPSDRRQSLKIRSNFMKIPFVLSRSRRGFGRVHFIAMADYGDGRRFAALLARGGTRRRSPVEGATAKLRRRKPQRRRAARRA
jgi:hypothetical protein